MGLFRFYSLKFSSQRIGTGGVKNNITFTDTLPQKSASQHNVFVSRATSLCISPRAIKMSPPGRRGQFSIRLRGGTRVCPCFTLL